MNKIAIFGVFLLGLIMLTLSVSAQSVPLSSFFYGSDYSNRFSDSFVDQNHLRDAVDESYTYVDNDISHTRINYRPISGRLYLGTYENERVSDTVRDDRTRVNIERHTNKDLTRSYETRNSEEFGSDYPTVRYNYNTGVFNPNINNPNVFTNYNNYNDNYNYFNNPTNNIVNNNPNGRFRYYENPRYGGISNAGGVPLIPKSECKNAFGTASDIRECERRYERERDLACGVYKDSSDRSRCKRDFDSGRFFEDQRRIYRNEADFLNDADVYYDDQYGLDGRYRNIDGSRRYFVSG